MQTLNFLKKIYYEKKSLILNITLNGKEKSTNITDTFKNTTSIIKII